MPGSKIPIVSTTRLHSDPVGVVLVLAWNWADEIIAKEQSHVGTTRFFVPLPESRVV